MLTTCLITVLKVNFLDSCPTIKITKWNFFQLHSINSANLLTGNSINRYLVFIAT